MQSNHRPLFPYAAIIISLFFSFCRLPAQPLNPYPSIGVIPPPVGYHRVPVEAPSFASCLRKIPLKKDRTVYLYNGHPNSQDVQFAYRTDVAETMIETPEWVFKTSELRSWP